MVTSKDKFWHSMHEVLRERDAEIEALRVALSEANARIAAHESAAHLRCDERVQQLLERTANLEDALKTFLDQEEEEKSVSEGDVNSRATRINPLNGGMMSGNPVGTSTLLITSNSTLASSCAGDIDSWMGRVPSYAAALPALPQSTPANKPSAAGSFSFAAVIDWDAENQPELGAIGEVDPVVLRSIEAQLEHHCQRVKEGRTPACPGAHFSGKACFWAWIVAKGPKEVRWTIENSRKYACASCFCAKRACLLWKGNRKWILLPLPPEVVPEAATWRDAEYYIYIGKDTVIDVFPGVWPHTDRPNRRKRPKVEEDVASDTVSSRVINASPEALP